MQTITRSLAASVVAAFLLSILPAASVPALARAPGTAEPTPFRDDVVQRSVTAETRSGRRRHTAAGPDGFAVPPLRSSASLAVILFTLPDSGPLNVTPGQARQLYFGAGRSVAAVFREASGGSFDLTGQVFGPYSLDVDDSGCSTGDWASAARDAAAAAGVDLSAFDHQAYLFGRMTVCPWNGLAAVGGAESFINNPATGELGLYHAAHELGHDLGSLHAHSLACRMDGQKVAIGPSAACSVDEYGDPYSLMGAGIVRAPSGWERLEMGLLPQAALLQVDTPGAQTVRVPVVDDPSDSPTVVLISRGDGTALSLEYHQSRGAFDHFASSDPAIHGVLVRLINADGSSSLLDATPGTQTTSDAPLARGKSLSDPEGGITLTVTGTGEHAATVEVDVIDRTDVSPDTTAPLPTAGLEARDTTNGRVTLSWLPGVDNVAVVGYRVLRNGTDVGTVDRLGFVDQAAANKTVTYVVQAIDAAGNVSAEQTVKVDASPPTRPGAIRWHRVAPGTVTLSWADATDDDRVVGYIVRLDARHVVHTRSLSLRLHYVAPRHHFVRVWAVDRSGNVGAPRTLEVAS